MNDKRMSESLSMKKGERMRKWERFRESMRQRLHKNEKETEKEWERERRAENMINYNKGETTSLCDTTMG